MSRERNPGTSYTDEDGRVLQTGICEAPDHVLLRVTDGDEVEELADLISGAGGTPSELADAILRAGYRREGGDA